MPKSKKLSGKQQKLDQQQKHFNKISKTYFRERQNPNHLMFKHLLWSNFFSRNKEELPSKNIVVLEAMAGYGEGKNLLEKYFQRGFQYEAFDYADEMVKIAKKLYPKDRIFQADITKFNANNRYDIVIIIGGLHHVYRFVDESLKNIVNSMKSGGYLILLEPTSDSFLTSKIRDRIYRKNPYFDYETEKGFKLKDLNNKLCKSGLDIIDQLYPGLLAYVLYYNPDAFKDLRLGGTRTVRVLYGLERLFYRTWLARKMSFATLTLARRK